MDNVRRAQKPRPQVAKKSFQNPLTSPTICGIIKAWLREMKMRPNRKELYYGKA
jgi:hypothetical protein